MVFYFYLTHSAYNEKGANQRDLAKWRALIYKLTHPPSLFPLSLPCPHQKTRGMVISHTCPLRVSTNVIKGMI